VLRTKKLLVIIGACVSYKIDPRDGFDKLECLKVTTAAAELVMVEG